MSRILSFPAVIILLLAQFSCTDDPGSKQQSTGKMGEMMVVMDKMSQWDDTLGRAVRFFFEENFPMQPQEEPLFDLFPVEMQNFKGNQVFQTQHNILLLVQDAKKTTGTVEMQRDYWAVPQLIIRISASTDTGIINTLKSQIGTVISLLNENERNRSIGLLRPFADKTLMKEVSDHFQLGLEIPKGFYTARKTGNFMWLKNETEKNSLGLLIYEFPYTDTALLLRERILSLRDSLTKTYVPGPTEGSYMAVSREVIEPSAERINFQGMFAVVTRGLWKTVNDFMGGSFVSYTIVDEKKGRVITIDGYVFAPNMPKRNFILQLEGIIYSLKLNGQP